MYSYFNNILRVYIRIFVDVAKRKTCSKNTTYNYIICFCIGFIELINLTAKYELIPITSEPEETDRSQYLIWVPRNP